MSIDVIAFGAHPDDLEVSMGGTASKLVAAGLRVLFVDLTDGEPARYAPAGIRRENATRAAEILGVERLILDERDRLLQDSVALRLTVARLIRTHRPRLVFGTQGDGVHPDHSALTDISSSMACSTHGCQIGTAWMDARCWLEPIHIRSTDCFSHDVGWNVPGRILILRSTLATCTSKSSQ